MRVLIIVVVLAALGLGAYFLGQGAPGEMEDAASAPEATPDVVVEEAEVATDDVTETAAEATEEATTAVEEAVGTATEAAQEAAGTANEALGDLTDGAADMAEDAADTASAAAEAANDAANAVLDAATTDASELSPRLDDALARDGFDFDTATAAIDDSEVSEMTKRAARAALEGARDNPELLPAAITQARSILGLE